jgi:hypothetical protein
MSVANMRLQLPHGRAMWVGRRPNGGLAIQQGTSRILLSEAELPIVLDAIDELMNEPTRKNTP